MPVDPRISEWDIPKQRGPSRKAKHYRETDSAQYREGKVKSTSDRGVKQTLKPCACKRSEPRSAVTACLLHNEPASCRRRRG